MRMTGNRAPLRGCAQKCHLRPGDRACQCVVSRARRHSPRRGARAARSPVSSTRAAASSFFLAVVSSVAEAQGPQPFNDGSSDHDSCKPLVVRRHYVPRRVRLRSVADHVLVRAHVLVPVLSLACVGQREFPVLVGVVESLEEAILLLVLEMLRKNFSISVPLRTR